MLLWIRRFAIMVSSDHTECEIFALIYGRPSWLRSFWYVCWNYRSVRSGFDWD